MRLVKAIPFLRLLMLAEVALLAGRHVAKLDPAERRRLVALVADARGRPSKLSEEETDELHALVEKLEPRLLAGSVVAKLSPLPIPKRILYGKRSGAPPRP